MFSDSREAGSRPIEIGWFVENGRGEDGHAVDDGGKEGGAGGFAEGGRVGEVVVEKAGGITLRLS